MSSGVQSASAFAAIPRLVARNLVRNLPRLWAMGLALLLVFALLLLGNALLAQSTEGFRRVYTAYVTGDLTVGPAEAGIEDRLLYGHRAL